jgi:hypothetical protein
VARGRHRVGTADDGGLFFSERSGIISCTTKCLYDRQSINNMNA